MTKREGKSASAAHDAQRGVKMAQIGAKVRQLRLKMADAARDFRATAKESVNSRVIFHAPDFMGSSYRLASGMLVLLLHKARKIHTSDERLRMGLRPKQ